MTLRTEETGVLMTPVPSNHRRTNRPTKDSRSTQLQRVLELLLDRDEVCSVDFYRLPIPRFAVHIHLLRREGYWITKRPCDLVVHNHEGHCWLYRLEALPESAL